MIDPFRMAMTRVPQLNASSFPKKQKVIAVLASRQEISKIVLKTDNLIP